MKYFVLLTILLFGTIGFVGWRKGKAQRGPVIAEEIVQEIPLGTSTAVIPISVQVESSVEFPEVDRVKELFELDQTTLPIVETISFTSRVPWLRDRPAWISDYASHYQTSRHFIARSLNGKPDYFTQKVHPGDRFNVLKSGKDIQFYLAVDLSRCRMWFFYLDGKEKVLLKTYRIGLGKKDPHRSSRFLTPVGKYLLGEKVAIYKPGITGLFQDQKVEMIQVFGTRWLPFEKEIQGCSEPAKGFGIHGLPWIQGTEGQLIEDRSKLGSYESDGCIRMASEDIEELFAIVITKPTFVEIFEEFKL